MKKYLTLVTQDIEFKGNEKAFDSIEFTPIFEVLAREPGSRCGKHINLLRPCDFHNGATLPLKLHRESKIKNFQKSILGADASVDSAV